MAINAITGQTAGPVADASRAPPQLAKGTTQATATPQPNSTSSAQSTKPAASYSVSISSAARAALAEATETSVQTAQEARRGDLQAQRMLARENAQKAALNS
ncbi:hypothetical protein B0G57_101650 [Trinickia symbiotica]|nr:hypothetical protein B0G57_101650 [Trinickia symbiotica]